MSAVDLARLASVVLALLSILSSFITWVPAPWHPEVTVPGGLLVGAAITTIGAWWLGRRPPGHWAHRSSPMWLVLGVMGTVVALLVAG